ncbi:MAG: hypothetical protein Q4B12_02915 [Bowdeniella nasicola]|nr:hypothetical protein [Bowdeniella nasicola]
MTPGLLVVLLAAIWGWVYATPTLIRFQRAAPVASATERPDVGIIAVELAERLRAGTPLAESWRHTATLHGLSPDIADDGVPAALAQLGPAGHILQAAFPLAERTGAGLSDILDACAQAATAADDAAAARAIALAGPRASARILAGLPLLGMGGAALAGIDVLGSISDGGVGTVNGLVGAALWIAGVRWSRYLIKRASEQPAGEHALLDLAAAALHAGASVPATLHLLAEITDRPHLASTARQLIYGRSWESAWEDHRSVLAQCLEPAWHSGASAIGLLRRRAERERAALSRQAREAAGALASTMVLPLGLCYLPAFVALALVPTVISLLGRWFT